MTTTRQICLAFLLGLLATAAVPFLVGITVDLLNGPGPEGGARRTKAIAHVAAIQEALQMFEQAHGRLPSLEQGLQALIPEYLDHVPIDPWGNAYVYSPNSRNGSVVSFGADGKPEGEGVDRDISIEELSRRGERERASKEVIPYVVSEALFFVSLLTIPLIAYLLTQHVAWSSGALAGSAALFALLPLGVAGMLLVSLEIRMALLPAGIGLVFAVATVAILKHVRYACGTTVIAMVSVLIALWLSAPRIMR